MKRLISAGMLLLGAASCDPRKFDDLKGEAWIAIAERDDTQTQGDFGIDVLALPPPSGGGSVFVVSAAAPPGMAQVTLDEGGGVKEQIGFNGELTGRGTLEPLDSKESPTGLASFDGDQFLTGVKGRNMVIRYTQGLKGGLAILPTTSAAGTGLAVASGNLGLGTATPDVVAVGTVSLTVLADGDMTKTPVTCNMKPPNASTAPPVQVMNVTIAPMNPGAGHNQIVVSTFTIDNSARILILEAGAIVNGQDCPTTGFPVASPPPVAIAVGNLDGNPLPEIVTGSVGAGGATGAVRIYANVGVGDQPTAIEVPLSKDEKDTDDFEDDGSSSRGSRIVIADLGDGAENEFLVSDPGANVGDVSAAGRVNIYRMQNCTGKPTRGTGGTCLVRTLFDPDPSKNDYFGRAVAVGDFVAGGTTSKVLGICQKAKLWVYFRVFESTADPRK